MNIVNTFSYENKPYKVVIYCSKAIDNDYIEYLKNEYSGEKNEIGDNYKEAEDVREKELIEEIVQKAKAIREKRKIYEEIEQDEEER